MSTKPRAPKHPQAISPKPYGSWLFKRLGFEWEGVDWAGFVCAWVGYFNWFGWSVRIESPSRDTTWKEAQG